jgi:formamidopyrimidine-DNA glycosylase
MPELPEVEVVRRSLAPALTGSRIVGVEVRRPRMIRRQPRARDFADRLNGRIIEGVGRHGKFLLADIEGDLTWVTHLGMSGHLQVAAPGEEEELHTNVVITTDRSQELRFVDPRTFGFMAVLTPEEVAASSLRLLGPDAHTALPRAPRLAESLQHRSAPIKAVLLDQHFVAGLGNIYADEVLFRAGIRPDRPAGSLSGVEVKRLRGAVRPVLESGLRWGGTSLDDLAYLLPDGRAGENLARLKVYGREDEPCRRCGNAIRRSVIRQRSSFWCATCQQ